MQLSIITVCYNAADDLEKTIESVLRQTGIDDHQIEHLIIDNESTDNTSGVVSNYSGSAEKKGIRVRYVCEPDNGIYDAMNKGITLSLGDWLILLNAGDTFYADNTLAQLFPCLETDSDVLVGRYNRLNPSGSIIVIPPDIDKLRDRMVFCHQAIVFRTSTHKNFLYNTTYHIAADYDALLRMYINNGMFKYIDVCMVNYDVTGLSAKRMIDTHKEIFQIRKDNHIIDNKVKATLRYEYGLIKRVILSKLPQGLRWRLVRLKNKYFKNKYL